MKVPSLVKFFLLAVCIVWWSCSPEITTLVQKEKIAVQYNSLSMVPGQLPIPNFIKSVQFHKKNTPNSAPILTLGTNETLEVTFDELSSISGQFIVRFTHHDKDWQQSNQPEALLFSSFSEFTVQGGMLNGRVRPGYYTYNFEFPNRDVQFQISGNYLMHVYDYQSGRELFSLPFFVSENTGELRVASETVFNSGPLGSAQDEIGGDFIYPDFVKFPQFELAPVIFQNRFWAESKSPNEIDAVKENVFGFRLTRDQLFPAYLDFNFLDINSLSLQNPQIYGYESGEIPHKLILKDDYLNFSADPRVIFESGFGRPNPERGRYVETNFRFNDGGSLGRNKTIYLLGDFNQWTVSEQYKLDYNTELRVYETKALIKQGSYQYKYVEVENGQTDFLSLNDSITKNNQEYTVLIYYRDPVYLYDRLLSIQQLVSTR